MLLASIFIGILFLCLLVQIEWIRPNGFSIMMIAAFASAFAIGRPRAAAIGLGNRQYVDVIMIALITGVAGSFMLYAWENWSYLSRNSDGSELSRSATIQRLFNLERGGMIWYGGIFLAAPCAWLYAQCKRFPVPAFFDALTPAVLAGLSLGRIGCWMNGCCYGRPTTLPWGLWRDEETLVIHPTQLYESIFCLCAFVILTHVQRYLRVGTISAMACVGYGSWRFFNESLRADHFPGSEATFFGLFTATSNQILSLYVAGFGTALLIATNFFSNSAKQDAE